MSPFFVFSTINNPKIEEALSSRLPGIVFVSDPGDADAALLVTRSEKAGAGVPANTLRDYLRLAERMPVALVAGGPGGAALADVARDAGVPEENIVVPAGSLPVAALVDVIKRLSEEASSLKQGRKSAAAPDLVAAPEPEGVHVSEPATGRPFSPEPGRREFPVHGCPKPKILEFLEKADRVCTFFGAKGGVGTSAVAAMVNEALRERGAAHLELADTPGAWRYYGKTSDEALRSGKYFSLRGAPRRANILLVDVSRDASAEDVSAALYFADCRVMVADVSEISFGLVREYLEAGVVPDVLAVCRTFPGVGNGAELYAGEFEKYGVGRVIGVPGSVEIEKALVAAQRRGVSPCGLVAELDTAAGELAAALLAKIQ